LRNDPLYLGERVGRITGERWDTLLEEFVAAACSTFPGVMVQFEDFNTACAFRLLQRYRDRLCCFNDDVQGTGAMGLAGLYAAGRITARKLSEQRILFVGAGEACLGIGNIVVAAMRREGLSDAAARQRCLFADSKGLVVTGRSDLSEHKRPFAQDRAPCRETVLIGASGKGGLFTQAVLAAMARMNERPIVFALSNPTANAECTAEQAYAWTDGRAVFASGSPFAPVTLHGRLHVPGQGNNCYVFPGVGLGGLMSGARRATDEMFFAAAQALAGQVSPADVERGRIFPGAARMREVAAAVAVAVATVAYEQSHAARTRPSDLVAEAVSLMYEPRYGPPDASIRGTSGKTPSVKTERMPFAV
jgi:malate dehydrogenase (oxaloacetate-decarboxylating)(NADP+)